VAQPTQLVRRLSQPRHLATRASARAQQRHPPQQSAHTAVPVAPRVNLKVATMQARTKTPKTQTTARNTKAMTSPTPPAAQRKRIGPKPVFLTGFVTFLAVLVLIGYQVAQGKDPSLGHGPQNKSPKVVHRVIKRTVITKVYDPAPTYSSGYSSGYSGGSTGSSYSGGGSSGGYSAPSSSAPSYSAPSYSAPAPAPAPSVSTSSSGG